MITPKMAEGEKHPRKMARIWLLSAAVLGIIILGDLSRRMTDARRLEQDSNLLQTEVAWLEAENVRLQTQIVEATSEAFIEAWAHGEGKMVRLGERLIVPVPASGFNPTPTPFITSSGLLPNKWQVWWALLFGEQP
jgi:cell division protein FtsB